MFFNKAVHVLNHLCWGIPYFNIYHIPLEVPITWGDVPLRTGPGDNDVEIRQVGVANQVD